MIRKKEPYLKSEHLERLTFRVPPEHKHAIWQHAHEGKSSVAMVMRKVVSDFIENLKDCRKES